MAHRVRRCASDPRLQRLPRRPGEARRRAVSIGFRPCGSVWAFFIATRSLWSLPRSAPGGHGALPRHAGARRLPDWFAQVAAWCGCWGRRCGSPALGGEAGGLLLSQQRGERFELEFEAGDALVALLQAGGEFALADREDVRAQLEVLAVAGEGLVGGLRFRLCAAAGFVEALQPESLGGQQHGFREAVQGGGSGIEAAGEAAPPLIEQRVDGVGAAAADRWRTFSIVGRWPARSSASAARSTSDEFTERGVMPRVLVAAGVVARVSERARGRRMYETIHHTERVLNRTEIRSAERDAVGADANGMRSGLSQICNGKWVGDLQCCNAIPISP